MTHRPKPAPALFAPALPATHEGATGTGEHGEHSYAQWVRRMIRAMRTDRNLLIPLFESSVAEPLALLHPIIADAFGRDAISSRYTSAFASGNPFVVDMLTERYGVGRDHVLCTTGATGALSLLYRALVRPGERILIENPCFDLFHTIARLHGYGVDRFERDGDTFALRPDAVAAAITPETRLIVLSNLHNPSGVASDGETLAAIGRIAQAHGIPVVVDEVYGDYAPPELRPPHAAALSPACISVSSLTKSHGLSTLRCGWIVAAPDVLAPVRAFAEESEFGVSNLAHAIAALVLEREPVFAEHRDRIMRNARPILASYHDHWRAEELVRGELPPFGCTIFPRLVGISDTLAFSEWLADRCGVLVAPGEYFGAPGHIRIGFAQSPADLDYGLQALTDGLRTWRDMQTTRKETA